MTNEEIDRLVAEKVLGLTEGQGFRMVPAADTQLVALRPVDEVYGCWPIFCPSTDLNHAIEAFWHANLNCTIHLKTWASAGIVDPLAMIAGAGVKIPHGDSEIRAAETAPHPKQPNLARAICSALLAAVGVEVSK